MAGAESPLLAEMWARERQTVADQVAAGIAAHVEGEDHRRPRGLVVLGCVIGSPATGGGGGGLAEIARYTVPAGAGEATIDFTGLDQTYDALEIWGNVKNIFSTATNAPVEMRFNGDSASNYRWTAHYDGNYGGGSFHSTDVTGFTGESILVGSNPGNQNNAQDSCFFRVTINRYAANDQWFKNVLTSWVWFSGGNFYHATGGGYWQGDGTGWPNIPAVTRLTFTADQLSGHAFAPGSQIIVYGIKGS